MFAAAVLVSSCSEETPRMPWEDDPNFHEYPEPGDDETTEVEVGQVLPGWSEGNLDIHLINTGRGECLFHILPDGTTLLIDAGETKASDVSVPQRPNDNVRPYITDSRYIKHFLPAGKTSIDWCAPSHYHIDHIGTKELATETAPGGYGLSGLTAVYQEVPFDRILDLGYPTYNDDNTIPATDGNYAANWITFVKWAVANKGVKADRYRPGEEQIKLVNDPGKYPDFKILTICANGYICKIDAATGAQSIVNAKAAAGNPASAGIHLKYGKFDYVTCGDLTSAPQNHVSNYIKAVIPTGGFEVFKGHHHLSANSWGSGMQKNNHSPRVIVNQNFSNYQPDNGLLESIFSGKFANATYTWQKDLFTTNGHADQVAANAALWNQVTGYNGHIVVRVAPGGDQFYVYMLDDTNFDYKVKSIHGPYTCK